MSMELNSVTTNIVSYQGTDATDKTKETKSSKDVKSTKEKESKENTENTSAATYEKGETKQNGIYSINKMSEADRAALSEQLKADAEARKAQLINIVNESVYGQAETFAKASDDESFWRKLARGEINVDPATRAQAQKDIAEDGYYGVKQTSQRMFDFACALAGDDVDKMKEMQEAMKKGYAMAQETWGGELPGICQKTLEAANKLFDDYYKSKGIE